MGKKPALLAGTALVIYAFQNVLMEVKLARFNVIALVLCAELVMLPLTLSTYAYLRSTGNAPEFPRGVLFLLTLLTGLLWWLGDVTYVSAYTMGGKVEVIATIVALFPVMTSLVKYFWTGGVPNRFQLAGYVLAAAAVYLTTRGTSR